MPSDTFEIPLTTLTYGGDTLGRLPEGSPRTGLAVFVPYALPGETVRVRLVEEKRGHARAELLEVLNPSPDRVIPRCPHFFSIQNQQSENNNLPCGGCHYQHLSYLAQLAAKTAILREQLERLGRLKNPPILPPVPSPSPWNYRNYVQFCLTPQGRLGFEALQRNRIVPIRECHLPETPINQLWPQLDLEPLPGLERVSLRVGADEDMMLILEGGDPQSLELVIEELPISALHLSPAGALVLAGSEYVTMEVESMGVLGSVGPGSEPVPTPPPLSRLFRVSAESFFPINTPQAGAMVDLLLSNLPLTPSTILLEVDCGLGLFSAFLAPRLGRLIGIESSPSACLDFESNLNEYDNVELYEAAAEQVLPALDLHPDVILVNPPRAGLSPRVLDGILGLNPAALAYVSCDPATLARDARRFIEGGYHLRQITPFDLHPQTYHIESISFWEK
jgi:23S rRNA (uracil1939-C5)-methyltransferase